MAAMQVQNGVQRNVNFQPAIQKRSLVLEQNAEIHNIEPEKKENNFPIWVILGLVVMAVLVVGGFAYFYLTR